MEDKDPRRSGRLSEKDSLDYQEKMDMNFTVKKRKRVDSHTFQETQRPEKVQRNDQFQAPTQTGRVNTVNPPFVPPTFQNMLVQPPPPPHIPIGSTPHIPIGSNIQSQTSIVNLSVPKFRFPMPNIPLTIPPPMMMKQQQQLQQLQQQQPQQQQQPPPQQQQQQQLQLQQKVDITTTKENILPPPPLQNQVIQKKEPEKKKRKKRHSDEEYEPVEEEENPEDYTLAVTEDNFYYSNARRRNRVPLRDRRKIHEEADYVMEEEDSSESIGEVNEVLEEGELEDIKRIQAEMAAIAAEKKAEELERMKELQQYEQTVNVINNNNNSNVIPTGGGDATNTEEDEGSGEDSQKKYNFRDRKVDPRKKNTEFGSVVVVSNSSNSSRRKAPFDRYEKIERKRKKKNEKIRKMMRKARKNVPRSPHVKIGDTTSSSDEDGRNVAKFLRSGGNNMQQPPNSFNRITPVNRGVESRRLGYKPTRADVDPVAIDKSVTWDSIGGLKEHIIKLKEMVILPLLYPDVYTNLGIKPPRGVLFVGPPGTGKTLTARALCNMCRVTEQKEIAFFMRKGADILSKWVGEAEKQLRLLFERAKELQPSIIFFDEIDGLAPVRSSKQDYIHTSIVSTLLALMDGLDDRGKVVVIGATNRADAVDPALRRPGRFDRELFFPLPDEKERKEILDIHTKEWDPPVNENIKLSLAKRAVGFCGADLKSLCTETGLKALRRKYPQIYTTTDRLRINPDEIVVQGEDWEAALKEMTPSYYKTREFFPVPLNVPLQALFKDVFPNIQGLVKKVFPIRKERHGAKTSFEVVGGSGMADGEEDPDEEAFWNEMGVKRESRVGATNSEIGKLMVFRPSFIIFGPEGNAQCDLLKALLHTPELEYFRVYHLTLEKLFDSSLGGGGYTTEERLISLFKEVRSNAPCILAIPSMMTFWQNVTVATRNLFVQSIRNFPPHLPILTIATVSVPKFENVVNVVMEDEDEEEDDDDIGGKAIPKIGGNVNENAILEKERKDIRQQFLAMVPDYLVNLFRHHFQIISPNYESRGRFLKLITDQIRSPILLSDIPTPENENNNDDDEIKQNEYEKKEFEVDEERKKKLMKRLLREEKGYIDQLQDCFYRICNTLLSDRHFRSFHRPKIEKPKGYGNNLGGFIVHHPDGPPPGRRGRGRPRKKETFIVEEEEDEYEEDILENIDPDAEFKPRKKVKPPPLPLNIPQHQIVPPPPPKKKSYDQPLPEKLVYMLDILEEVNQGTFITAGSFLKAFEVFRDHGSHYENYMNFSGYGRTGGYGGSAAQAEEEWRKRKVIEAGKNLYKRVEISLQTIEGPLLKECKRISKRRKRRIEDEEKKKKELEELERKRLIAEEKKKKEMLPPMRRVTRSLKKKLDSPSTLRKKKKKGMKIKLPKMIHSIIPNGMLESWELRILQKTRGWSVEKLEALYSRWLREVTRFKWQPKRERLLKNLESILEEERVR